MWLQLMSCARPMVRDGQGDSLTVAGLRLERREGSPHKETEVTFTYEEGCDYWVANMQQMSQSMARAVLFWLRGILAERSNQERIPKIRAKESSHHWLSSKVPAPRK